MKNRASLNGKYHVEGKKNLQQASVQMSGKKDEVGHRQPNNHLDGVVKSQPEDIMLNIKTRPNWFQHKCLAICVWWILIGLKPS